MDRRGHYDIEGPSSANTSARLLNNLQMPADPATPVTLILLGAFRDR